MRVIEQQLAFSSGEVYREKNFASTVVSLRTLGYRPSRMRPRGGVVTQRIANPCIPVRFWARPPISLGAKTNTARNAWPTAQHPSSKPNTRTAAKPSDEGKINR
jgi:hypothetical protein